MVSAKRSDARVGQRARARETGEPPRTSVGRATSMAAEERGEAWAGESRGGGEGRGEGRAWRGGTEQRTWAGRWLVACSLAMFRAERTLDLVELNDDDGRSAVTLAPERGRSSRASRGRSRRALPGRVDAGRPTKNVRGGVPLLFPSPGRLAATASSGRPAGAMKQHGFARDVAWKLRSSDRRDAARRRSRSSRRTRRAPSTVGLPTGGDVRAARRLLRLDVTRRRTRAASRCRFALRHPPVLPRRRTRRARRSPPQATRAFDNVTKQVSRSTAST